MAGRLDICADIGCLSKGLRVRKQMVNPSLLRLNLTFVFPALFLLASLSRFLD